MLKISRLPNDSAQVNSEINIDESSTLPQQTTKSHRPSAQTLRESFLESERHEGKQNISTFFSPISVLMVK